MFRISPRSRPLAVSVLMEMTWPPVSRMKLADPPCTCPGTIASRCIRNGNSIVGCFVRQLGAHHQLEPVVIDDDRHPERERREALHFARRQADQRRILDDRRHVLNLERADLQLVEPRQLELAHAEIADAGAQDVDDGTDAHPCGRLAGDDSLLGSRIQHHVHQRPTVDARFDDDFFVDHAKRHGVQSGARPASMFTGGFVPNARRKRTSARAHAAFALRSLFGSRLM